MVHIEITLSVLRPISIIFSSYGYQGCAHVANERPVFVFLGCITSRESNKFIYPLSLSLSVNILLRLNFQVALCITKNMLFFIRINIFYAM